MSLDQDLVKLVREVVKAELNSSRTNATEIVGRGGDTVLSSMGNIFIQPGTNKKAYYHETEVGSGSGSGVGGDVVANATRTVNKLVKWTNTTTKEIGNSGITDTGTNVTITLGTGGTLTITRV